MIAQNIRDSVFISYSHIDDDWASRFNKMLDTQQQTFRIFRDPDISTGEDWESRLQGELARTKIALLLVSTHFVTSKYITERELPWIVKARKDGLVVYWVEVEPTTVPAELKDLQAFKVQSTNRAVSQFHGGDQDAEIRTICEQIAAYMETHPRIPRWKFFNQVSEVVQRRFGYNVRREIATGDHSVVYTADEPGNHVVVKARVMDELEEGGLDQLGDIESEFKKAKKLKHRAFMALRDWTLDTEPQIMVTEFVAGHPLTRLLEREGRLTVDRVRFITQTIAEALSEYHQAGLIYSNIRPSDVLITKPNGGEWYPRISAFRASQLSLKSEQRTRNFVINRERLTYLAPEQYQQGEVTQESDQYALGLLAIEMLQGRPPVQVSQLSDLEQKRVFFDDPQAYGGEWLTRSPELTDIILRMLHPDPNKRWPTMMDLATVLGSGSIIRNNRWLVKESYKRLEQEHETFFHSFYDHLFAKDKKLQAKFPRKHDWQRQHALLRSAVCSLINFSEEHGVDEPTILSATAKEHKKRGLAKKDFEAFEDAFIKTLVKFGEGSEELEAAWRACFKPGMDYMKRHATSIRHRRKSTRS